jgi:enoyl-CoA hydratase/carnithine racemase
MEFETLLYDEDEGVATITLNRPEVLNAFDQQMQDELRDVWLGLRTNDDVRAVILTGAGDKAFCAGIDREEAIAEDYLANEENRNKMQSQVGPVSTPFMYNDPGVNINPKMNDLWKPVVAAVNGIACGGALYLLGESDIIIAADHATFFDPHVTYGMVAGFESVHLLQKLPLGEVLRMMLLGAWERMSAERAHQMGLVSEVVPQAELLERAMWVARAIARHAPGDLDDP